MIRPIVRFEQQRANARLGGGQRRVDAQHTKGKLTARERINLLLDEGTFEEYDAFVQHQCQDFGMNKKKIFGDGVITGWGLIFGRPVFVFAKDFTVFGGSLSVTHARKINKIQDMALASSTPIIGLFDAGGARIQEGVDALGGYGEVFYRNVQASGKIPQISLIMGPCAGGDVYSPAITDFIFMVDKTSYMFVTGPDVVKTVTNEKVTAEDLGGASMHATRSSVVDKVWRNDVVALSQLRRFMSFLPQSHRSSSLHFPAKPATKIPSLDKLVPTDPFASYDIRHVINKIADRHDFFEIQPLFCWEYCCWFWSY